MEELGRKVSSVAVTAINRTQPRLPSYVHGATTRPLLFQTTTDCLRQAAENKPEKEFVVFRKQRIRRNFADIHKDAERLAAGFYELGLKRGDRVGMWGHNYYEWVVCQFATAMAGMIQVNINPAYRTSELHYALNAVSVRALIAPKQFRSSNYMQLLNEICPTFAQGQPGIGSLNSRVLPDLKHVIVFGEEEKVKGAWNFNDVANSSGSEARKLVDEAQNRAIPDDPVNIQFTSGTTGFPKAATLTHFGIVNNANSIGAGALWDKKDIKVCIPNPLYHCFGCIAGTLSSVIHQQTCVFPAINYKVNKILEAIEEEKCNFIFGTPTMFIDLLSSENFHKHDLSSLYGGFISGAPCSYALCKELQEKFSMEDLYVLYGATELSPLATMSLPSEPVEKRIKSVGHVTPHAEIQIVDDEGRTVPRGQRGEVRVRGYNVMRGYWGDETRTKKEITTGGWYCTGDTGIMNDDGSIMIVGRTKEMICKGGENIYPTEIEHFIHSLPYVSDVQVIGVPDDRLGENICAWVRLTHDFVGKITEEQIKEDCKGKMAPFKIPKYILIKEEADFPLTATGKVKKFELRKISKKLLGLESVESHFNE